MDLQRGPLNKTIPLMTTYGSEDVHALYGDDLEEWAKYSSMPPPDKWMKGKFAHVQKPSPLTSRIHPSQDEQTWVHEKPKKQAPLDISQLPTAPQQKDDIDGDKKPAAKASQPKATTQTPRQCTATPTMPTSPKQKGKTKIKKQSTLSCDKTRGGCIASQLE